MSDDRLPIHPMREEDTRLILRWLRARTGQEPEPVITTVYKTDNMPPDRYWSPVHANNCRGWMSSFARRCRVPIREVGFLDATGTFTADSLKVEIKAYAADYAARNKQRLENLAKTVAPEDHRQYGPLAWRTRGWILFVQVATEFYAWLERAGLRPRGSNPFMDINRVRPLHFKQDTIVIAKWYERIFDYLRSKEASPYPRNVRDDAIFSLLFSGLRIREITEARAADFVFNPTRTSSLRIVGKGSKPRTVYLLYRQAWSVNRWIVQYRRMSATPWLFPSNRARGPMNTESIRQAIYRVINIVFDKDEEAWIRKKITPHKFRHYYASSTLAGGMNPIAVQKQLGHSNQDMLSRYTKGFDPKWVEEAVRAFDQGHYFRVDERGNPVRYNKRPTVYVNEEGLVPTDRDSLRPEWERTGRNPTPDERRRKAV